MCLAIPGKVKKIEGRKALIEYPGEERYAMIGDEGIMVGDYVQVQMGIAMHKIDSQTAEKSLAAWTKTGTKI